MEVAPTIVIVWFFMERLLIKGYDGIRSLCENSLQERRLK